jgi:hypothetical protein
MGFRADGGIVAAVAFADGAFVFQPPTRTDAPKRRKRDVTRIVQGVVPKNVRRVVPQVFFATFRLDSPTTRTTDGRLVAVFDYRPVWVAVFEKVEGERATVIEIPERPHSSSSTPSTTIKRKPKAKTVTTSYLVVVDDRTGDVLIRSEFGEPKLRASDQPKGPAIP